MFEESICPFCGASSVIMCMMDGHEFKCGTFVSTMKIKPSYHQSEECKTNSKKDV